MTRNLRVTGAEHGTSATSRDALRDGGDEPSSGVEAEEPEKGPEKKGQRTPSAKAEGRRPSFESAEHTNDAGCLLLAEEVALLLSVPRSWVYEPIDCRT